MQSEPIPMSLSGIHGSKNVHIYRLLSPPAGALMSRKPNKYRKIGQAALLGSCIGAGPAGFAAWCLGLTDCFGRWVLLKQESLRVGDLCLDVSENSGFSPQIIHFDKVFHYKPSILGYPYFWKHPFQKMFLS